MIVHTIKMTVITASVNNRALVKDTKGCERTSCMNVLEGLRWLIHTNELESEGIGRGKCFEEEVSETTDKEDDRDDHSNNNLMPDRPCAENEDDDRHGESGNSYPELGFGNTDDYNKGLNLVTQNYAVSQKT